MNTQKESPSNSTLSKTFEGNEKIMTPHKIRVQCTLTEVLSRKLEKAREKGLSDCTVVESALTNWFDEQGITV